MEPAPEEDAEPALLVEAGVWHPISQHKPSANAARIAKSRTKRRTVKSNFIQPQNQLSERPLFQTISAVCQFRPVKSWELCY